MPKPTILVVEDEVIIGLDIKSILSGLGFRILDVVPTGEEAI